MSSTDVDLREILRGRANNSAHRRSTGRRFRSYEDFVLEYGQEYEAAPLSRGERSTVQRVLGAHRKFWRRGFDYKHCFTNAQQLMAFDTTGAMVYVEGFVVALSDRLPPFHHGWLSFHGKVIDVTAPSLADVSALPPEPSQIHGEFVDRMYLGVPFLRRYVRERAKANNGWGSLLDDEKSGYALLERGGDDAVWRVRRRCAS